MIIKKTLIQNAYILKPKRYNDNRGYFEKQFCNSLYKKKKLNIIWKQINKSFNKKKYTFRGMHFQKKPFTEIKVVQCIKGKILDVIFDLRKNSQSFLKSYSIQLSEKKNELLYLPAGVAHGYLTLTDNVELMYFHSKIYNMKYSSGINIMEKKIRFKLKKKIKNISLIDNKLKFLNEV
ncbi:dTDP-4-dehydrorhamnose 3,5-epimerase family protein [Pelagibacteraceae bacterium]|nr:dTDP-4-dehydrorhamnose 3,5-epimerase family protein [Pelagibacteraceae bacterium]